VFPHRVNAGAACVAQRSGSTSHESPVTNHESRITSHESQVTRHPPLTTHHLPLTSPLAARRYFLVQLPSNCTFVQVSHPLRAGNINAACFAAAMMRHHNSAKFAAGQALPGASPSHLCANPEPLSRHFATEPIRTSCRLARRSQPIRRRCELLDRNSPNSISRVTHRKQTLGLALIRNKNALLHIYTTRRFRLFQAEIQALWPLSPFAVARPASGNASSWPGCGSAHAHRVHPASRSFRASYPFAQTPESYRPRRFSLLGWISIPRRSG
jgi:hypothetical protein